MGILQFLIIFNALLALTCVGETDVPFPASNSSLKTAIVINTTTAAPATSTVTPSSTSIKTSTIPTPPTSSTTKPTTPTTPTTTTPPPSTTTKSSTTTLPTTTSPPAPTPKPEPPKDLEPPIGDWKMNCTDHNILLHMAAQIVVPYETLTNETWKAYVNIPKNATTEEACAGKMENFRLMWNENKIHFNVLKNNSMWYVYRINVTIEKDIDNFPNMKDNSTLQLVYEKALFNASEKLSYKCEKLQTFNLTQTSTPTVVAFLHISHFQLQPFADSKATGFADAVDCEPPSTPDIVPIAAGCALAALILIVLVAYLIGRRRSQARGYLSMFTESKREEDYIPLKNLSCFT